MKVKKIIIIVILSLIALAVLIGGIFFVATKAFPDKFTSFNVIAVVNGDKIYESDFNNMVSGLYGSSNDATEAEKQSIYESLINTKLIEQECNARKLSITDKDIDAYLEEVIAANGVASKDDFYQQLETTYGYNKAFVDSLIKSSMEEKKLYDDVIASEVTIDEAVLKKAYDDNPSAYKLVEVSHILISVDDTTTQAVALAKAKALIVRLNAGEDFAALAKANSADTGSSVNGGVLTGYFGADNTTYVAEFVAGAVKLNKGEYTKDPVLSQFGYHIIKADDVKSSYEDVKDNVTEIIYGPIKEKAFIDFVAKLAEDGKIERKMTFDLTKDEADTSSNQTDTTNQ
ncbi:MAG: peptidylprolyl isomerase [Firmicutes bacterium]|nr:peptidylprolyl isomerase [Bacillota bacterium]